MCTVQKAKVISFDGKTALVSVLPSGSRREVECTRPVKINDIVDVFQNIMI